MERNRDPVKRRRYDSSRRQQQARQTRDAILDAAADRFLRDGFAASTIAAIATDVAVSVDTIYKTFGGKTGLVRAIYERGLSGEGPVHAEIRSDALQTSEPDPREILRGIGRLVTDVAPRVVPILLLVSDAAVADPEMAKLEAELDDQRLQRMTHNARNLARAGHLRSELTIEYAGLIMWNFTSPRLYQLLVVRNGWSIERFGEFTAASLGTLLLAAPAKTASRPARPARRASREARPSNPDDPP
jgi:AcrR family transcriptional regulator